MAPRTTASRSAALLVTTLALAAGLPAGTASGQSGSGLYEPFPEAAVKKRAQRYIESLGERTADPHRRFSDAQLDAGVFVGPGVIPPGLTLSGERTRGAASARAAGGGSDVGLWLQLLLATAAALPAAALVSRKRVGAA